MYYRDMTNAVVSGIISGLIVSVVVWFIGYCQKPRFELRYAASGKATLFNNRFRTVVLGGTWVLGTSDGVLSTADARAGTSSIILKRMTQTYWDTRDISVGDYVEISYRRCPLFPLSREKKQRKVQGWSKHPADWHEQSDVDHGSWKHAGIVFQHG